MSRRSYYVTRSQSNNEIWYTSSDGNVVTPYNTSGFGANIVSNTYSGGRGIITFDGNVTSIGSYAFRVCTTLTSITIPSSVTSIGNYAFAYCSLLVSAYIPNSVTSIGTYAFISNTTLTNLTIPSSVTTIGNYAFNGCSSLLSIMIPSGVTSIANGVFKDCSSLSGVSIRSTGITSIGENAFYNTDLIHIEIPGTSLGSFGASCFAKSSNLNTLVVHSTTPPTFGTSMLDNTSITTSGAGRILVPNASVNTYKGTTGWSSYAAVIDSNDD